MRDTFQSLLHRYRAARQWVSEKAAPLRDVWLRATAPIRTLLRPITEPLDNALAPVRSRWAQFKERWPLPGNILSGLLALIRWGFYLVLFLIVGV